MKKKQGVTKSVYLKKSTAEQLTKEAKKQNRPLSYIIAMILEQWINERKTLGNYSKEEIAEV